jgi:Uma2 family endonuclease
MALQTQLRYSFEDYLAAEREAEIRHEYVDGQVFDMVGATENHNIIVANLTALLVNQMKGRPCLVYATDMKVRIDVADACKYPDVTALCGERKFFNDRRDVLLNPSLIIEVLSDSTEAYDRGENFALYRQLPSLREYVLVSQARWRVEVYARQPDGRWLLTEYSGANDEVPLETVDCVLSLQEIYDKTELFGDRGKRQDLTP